MNPETEWLESDGLGGFASGTVGGPRTRRYHALLCAALTPPTGRCVLVNGFDAFVETDSGRFSLSSQRYLPDVTHPDGASRLVEWSGEPWPTWTFALEDGTRIVQELVVEHGTGSVLLAWRLAPPATARRKASRKGRRAHEGFPVRLFVRPFLSGRDFHASHRENPLFRFDATSDGPSVEWRPYDALPAVRCLHNGAYRHDPQWYRSFRYEEERARGFDSIEDCGSPGDLVFELSHGEAVCLLAAGRTFGAKPSAARLAASLRTEETARRAQFATPLERAADQFVVARGAGRTILAGYPWFADWGRDTFIALRGLCLSTGRVDVARSVLLEWSGSISQGMVPNRFPERGEAAPEYNSVDASLWFVVAVEELFAAAARARQRVVSASDEKRLLAAVRQILEAHVKGTRFGIRIDEDELLAAGEPGQQLTWMDARVDGRASTPRIGKPVEIQALWYNALAFAASALKDAAHWKSRAADVHDSFAERFWNEKEECLFDVVDVDHVKGATDASFRPNQILAIGGLPRPLLTGPRARKVVDAVEQRLLTPLGLRTLSLEDSRYRPRYEGAPAERDAAYHQGSAWPWLLGPFVDAWVGVRGSAPSARREARRRFVQPLLDRMAERGVMHLCELTDGEPPHLWRGCPFQAWSLGELLRVTSGAAATARAAG